MDFLLRFVLITIIHSNLFLLNILEQVKVNTYLFEKVFYLPYYASTQMLQIFES